MKQISIYLIIFIAILKVCYAQQPPPVIPPGPLVQLRAPDPGQWSIVNSVSNPNPNSGGSAMLTTTKYQFTKTRNTLHVTYTDSQQRVWQIWNIGNIHTFIWADGKDVAFGAPPAPGTNGQPLYIDLTQTDFPDFAWLTKSNFVDIEPVDGKQCLVFQDLVNFGGQKVLSRAMVDIETRLPVRFEGATGVSDYSFSDNPPESQTVPVSIQKAINVEARKEHMLAKIPAPAF